MFDCPYKFNSFETTGLTSIKLDIIYHHIKGRVISRLMMTDLKINCLKIIAFFDVEKPF